MMLVALDPGETIGIAIGGILSGESPAPNNGAWLAYDDIAQNVRWRVTAWEVSQEHLWDALTALALRYDFDQLIVERTLSPWRGMDPVVLKVTGIIEEWARQHKKGIYDKQKASDAKTFITDKKLRRYSLYQINKPHANDAMRHLLYYIEFGER